MIITEDNYMTSCWDLTVFIEDLSLRRFRTLKACNYRFYIKFSTKMQNLTSINVEIYHSS